eukprot:COSAG02_NODE_25947_length_644_cov_2.853211_1_plen_101_part_01
MNSRPTPPSSLHDAGERPARVVVAAPRAVAALRVVKSFSSCKSRRRRWSPSTPCVRACRWPVPRQAVSRCTPWLLLCYLSRLPAAAASFMVSTFTSPMDSR